MEQSCARLLAYVWYEVFTRVEMSHYNRFGTLESDVLFLWVPGVATHFINTQIYISFDNIANCRRTTDDKFGMVREVWDRAVNNFRKCYFPRENNTIDEQLFPCRSRCSFIQYMPQKPANFGIKFWIMCDTENYYVLNASPYVGREQERTENGLAQHVVHKLVAPFYNSGINLTVDSIFASLSLAFSLREKKSMIGTVRSNRREIPASVLNDSKHESATHRLSVYGQCNVGCLQGEKKQISCLHLDITQCRRCTAGGWQSKPEAGDLPVLQQNKRRRRISRSDAPVLFVQS